MREVDLLEFPLIGEPGLAPGIAGVVFVGKKFGYTRADAEVLGRLLASYKVSAAELQRTHRLES